MTEAGTRRGSRALAWAGAALDLGALGLALAWAARAALGARAWPLPAALHAWALAGPFLALGAAVALARRRRAAALLSLGLVVGWVAQHAARVARTQGVPAGALELVTLNAGNGRAAPADLVKLALEVGADALFLQELSSAQAAALEEGCAARYPFRELHGLGIRGVGVLSRRPLAGTRLVELHDGSLALFGEIELDGGRALAFAVVHLSAWVAFVGPWGGADEALERVRAELEGAEVALVAGDLNATVESPLLDVLREAGFRDAYSDAGSGLGLTFPEFLRYRGIPLPPLARIDHVLLRGLQARAARVVSGAGADHRALAVTATVSGESAGNTR